ncbi:YpdA family putative bacillithiol disulfide reductase [Neolewinella antarctica]|uniref:Thioredoxin reductase (NADPH) n=1 Tax=Neolewinella antarctica TaxID=442734 RepID=A0ABX0X903_9BACT|nr:YpdA family putative bacillithiol disulfide reductase [Neolewinella antarctica]NJC25735.1 thioredoxin reductase (NADPH) [Neolewinella antarctica]
MNYDLIIIGGGPSGINVAISAKKAGLNYLVLEKGALANSLYNFPVNMTFFSTSLKLEIQNTPFISHGDKPTRTEALEYYRRLIGSNEINIHLYEKVDSMIAVEGGYTITTNKNTYDTSSVCVATGFYDTPRQLDVPGEDLSKVRHYYDDPHVYIGQNVVVIGAANSACDAALETWRKGAKVTMVHRGKEISDRVKYWIKPDIENRIKEGSINVHYESEVTAIRETEVDINTPNGPTTLKNDFVLAMTGYQPNFALFERLGLKFDVDDACKPVLNADTLETNLPNVYMAGVACAGLNTSKLFIENTRDHGDIIVEDILRQQPELVA